MNDRETSSEIRGIIGLVEGNVAISTGTMEK